MTKIVACTSLAITLLAFALDGRFENVPQSKESFIPFVRILSSPEKFNGRVIVVSGVLSARHENVALYPGLESYRNGILENAFWLASPTGNDMSEFEGKWVILKGELNADSYGAFGLFAGTIDVELVKLRSGLFENQ